MRTAGLIALAATLLAALPAPAATLKSLRDHRRVILVFGPGADDPRVRRQLAQVRPLVQATDDRDLVLAQVIGDRAEGLEDPAAGLRRRFEVSDGRFAVLLIGKDGHVALRSATPVDGARLAATIDSMPMRQDEMRRAAKG